MTKSGCWRKDAPALSETAGKIRESKKKKAHHRAPSI